MRGKKKMTKTGQDAAKNILCLKFYK
jgi:hypothetical protein